MPQRRSPRLQGWDYSSAGTYFVTICTWQREHLFGAVRDGEMIMSPSGHMAQRCWHAIAGVYPDVELQGFVVMPNHVHGLLGIADVSEGFKTNLGNIIRGYKARVTAEVRALQGEQVRVWQGRYHDHIVRDQADLERIHAYIVANPARWREDVFFTS